MLDFLDRGVSRLARLGTWISALLVIAMTALVGYAVAMRYLFVRPQPWSDELVGYLLVAVVMAAAAEALLRDEHIAIDLITSRLSERARRWVEAWGMIAVALLSLVLMIGGWRMVAFSKMVGLKSEGYLAAPIHIPQAVVPIGAALLLLAALVRLLRLLRRRGGDPR